MENVKISFLFFILILIAHHNYIGEDEQIGVVILSIEKPEKGIHKRAILRSKYVNFI